MDTARWFRDLFVNHFFDFSYVLLDSFARRVDVRLDLKPTTYKYYSRKKGLLLKLY